MHAALQSEFELMSHAPSRATAVKAEPPMNADVKDSYSPACAHFQFQSKAVLRVAAAFPTCRGTDSSDLHERNDYTLPMSTQFVEIPNRRSSAFICGSCVFVLLCGQGGISGSCSAGWRS
jgi:hypothetical protein